MPESDHDEAGTVNTEQASEIAIERRHLIDVPGGRPIELDFSTRSTCGACVTTTNDAGDVVHDAECSAARTLASAFADQDASGGAVELTDEVRSLFAGEYADVVLDDGARVTAVIGTVDLSDDELAPLHGELSQAYLAGFRRAERAILDMARARVAKIREEVDRLSMSIEAWSPGGARGAQGTEESG